MLLNYIIIESGLKENKACLVDHRNQIMGGKKKESQDTYQYQPTILNLNVLESKFT